MHKVTSSNEQAYELTKHATLRLAQRNLSDTDVELVLTYGQRLRKAGATFVFLGRRDIPKNLRSMRTISRLEGTVVIMDYYDDTNVIITAYRDANLRDIKKKKSYDLKKALSSHRLASDKQITS